jgi:DNA-directed RNA polymerase specialized sigma24 family protein/ribosome-associated translation inhibitor RaiA
MSQHIVLVGCDEAIRRSVESYWERKLPRIQKLLRAYRPDQQELRLTLHAHARPSQKPFFEGRAVVHLPTGTVVAEDQNHDPQALIDRLADTLVAELKRHQERVRRDYVYRRKQRARADLSAAGPLLQRDQEAGRWEDFFQLLRPQLEFLRDHARRELRLLEMEGVLQRGELSVGDLLDEVVQLAWQRMPQRPARWPLSVWLTDLLHEVLRQWVASKPQPRVSLAERVETDQGEKPEVLEQPWWQALWGYDESLTLEDLLPGSQGTEAWDALEAEEQRQKILEGLKELPPLQRQALLLAALEDYDLSEIAMLQDRSEDEVRADIEAARGALRQRYTAAGHLREAPAATPAAPAATT